MIYALAGLAVWNVILSILLYKDWNRDIDISVVGDVVKRSDLNRVPDDFEEEHGLKWDRPDHKTNVNVRRVLEESGVLNVRNNHVSGFGDWETWEVLDVHDMYERLRLLYDHFDLEVQEECPDEYPKLVKKSEEGPLDKAME